MKKLLLMITMLALVFAGCQSTAPEATPEAEGLVLNTEATMDFGSISETNLYTNDYLGYQMQFPADFVPAIRDHVNAVFGSTVTEEMDLTTQALVPMAFVSKYDLTDQTHPINQNMTMTVEQAYDENQRSITVDEYLTLAKANLTAQFGANIGEFTKETINGVEFTYFKNVMDINGVSLVQYQYTTKVDKFFISIALTDSSEEEVMPTMIEAVKTFAPKK